ncbi:MAG: phosphatase PAP2 family protein [Phycisphaerales bacterium]|nr:phosphatase PAP2 family protein [Phycisphaerales bacterium]
MRYLTPRERKRRRVQRLRLAGLILAGFVVFTLLDFPLLHLLYQDDWLRVQNHDWYRLLRIMGYLGTWLLVCLVYIAHDRHQHRGLAVLLSAGLAGLLAELLKLVIARERPVHDGIIQPGLYHFRGLFSGFENGSNLGLPSSHAAVAFGGCLMLACFLPRARTLLFLLALGCGITRMLTGAHFATDVYVGALLGWACSRLFCSFAGVHVPDLRPRYRLPV